MRCGRCSNSAANRCSRGAEAVPELPEVEVVRRGLEPLLLGRTITGVDVVDERILRRQAGRTDALRAVVTGTRISAVVRRGKFLWLRLEDAAGETGDALMVHLGMSGQLRIRRAGGADATRATVPSMGPASDPHRHRRLTLHLDDRSMIDMVDQRIFGGLWISPLTRTSDGAAAGEGSPDALLPEAASAIARDLLDPAADLSAIAATIRARRAPVKSLLLSQGIVSGIGNIYADEALWAARVRYDTPGEDVGPRKARALLLAAREVMQRALAAGGTSFDALYVDVNGRSGYFSRSLNVYGREGDPCERCGAAIVREPFMNRSSFVCPRCQRPVRR